MPIKTEPNRRSDWLLYEEDELGRYSRDIVTVAPNQVLVSGTVLGLNAAGTQVGAYDNVGPDFAAAVGVLVEDITTGASPAKGVMLARHAKIAPSGLTWAAGLVDADKTQAYADLKALGILLATEV